MNGILAWLFRLPRRILSLRTIVIVGMVGVISTILVIGAWVWFGITNDQYNQLDRRLDSVSSLGDFSSILNSPPAGTGNAGDDSGLVRTARVGSVTISTPSDIVLPKFDDGYTTTTIDGVDYRVRTFQAGPASIARIPCRTAADPVAQAFSTRVAGVKRSRSSA